MDKKFSVRELRKTITVKSLSLLILLSTAILVGIEFINFFYMSIYEKATMENYRSSLEMYCSYWDNKFDMINSALFTYTGAGNDDSLFWNVCFSQDELTFQTGKTTLVRRMSELARNYESEILVFVYIPERNVFLKSTNNLVGYRSRLELDEDIKTYIENEGRYNYATWDYFQSSEEDFFIQAYKVDGSYIGSLIKCSTVLDGIEYGHGIIDGIGLADDSGEVRHLLRGEWRADEKGTEIFRIPWKCLEQMLCVKVQRKGILSDKLFLTILSLATILTGFLLLAWNVRFQMKNVLMPLNRLRKIMEDFSHGDLDVRLKESNTKNEIGVLYHAFNEMAEQIVSLKIDMYEEKLARERTQSNYLRVQIQPHFYTNVLNLIYGLAQMKNYQAIQELSMTTGVYFRYLLGEKGTFVLLREELECVRNYIRIQQIRYKTGMEFTMDIEEGVEKQMVLPMILQTFAGNSVKHNITLVPLLRIAIEIYTEEDRIFIYIRDNGIGFEKEILDKINRNEMLGRDGEHIGIMNVKERLRLFYGEEANVEISSEKGKTEVKVVLPKVISEEEKDEYYTGR